MRCRRRGRRRQHDALDSGAVGRAEDPQRPFARETDTIESAVAAVDRQRRGDVQDVVAPRHRVIPSRVALEVGQREAQTRRGAAMVVERSANLALRVRECERWRRRRARTRGVARCTSPRRTHSHPSPARETRRLPDSSTDPMQDETVTAMWRSCARRVARRRPAGPALPMSSRMTVWATWRGVVDDTAARRRSKPRSSDSPRRSMSPSV